MAKDIVQVGKFFLVDDENSGIRLQVRFADGRYICPANDILLLADSIRYYKRSQSGVEVSNLNPKSSHVLGVA